MFYRAISYVMPVTIMRIPYSAVEAVVWSNLTYWEINMAPVASRHAASPPACCRVQRSCGTVQPGGASALAQARLGPQHSLSQAALLPQSPVLVLLLWLLLAGCRQFAAWSHAQCWVTFRAQEVELHLSRRDAGVQVLHVPGAVLLGPPVVGRLLQVPPP